MILPNHCNVFLTIVILVIPTHCNFGSDLVVPFVSSIDPKFPIFIHRNIRPSINGSQLSGRFAIHKITIQFKNCTDFHIWLRKEQIIIAANTGYESAINAVFDETTSNLTKCTFLYYAKVYYNLHGYPLMVIYHKEDKKIIENSYIVKFNFADLQIDFDKLVYHIQDQIIVRCSLISPLFSGNIYRIKIISSDRNLQVRDERYLQRNHVLELIGHINPLVRILNFTCLFHTISVSNYVSLVVPERIEPFLIINHVALGVCLTVFLVVFIAIGIYLFIFNNKRKLSYDVTAHYTELVEDKTNRFFDPILNNLTSPMRKFALPGVLNAYQLRRNFQRFYSGFLAVFNKNQPTEVVDSAADIDKKKFREKLHPLQSSILGDRIIVTLGPGPQKILPNIKSSTSSASISTLSSEQSSARDVDSRVSLDPHIVGGLPYVKIIRKITKPYWSVKDTGIFVRPGVSPRK